MDEPHQAPALNDAVDAGESAKVEQIAAVQRAFEVVEALADARDGLSFTDIVGLLAVNRVLRTGAVVLLVGLLLFCGDLLARDFLGSRLFPMSAPIGGTLLIVGWLAIAASAVARQRS